jgi:DNA replication and repair protein RecF
MLVRGPPLIRRQLLDWGVFHVKHSYLPDWRRFRRALLQRNTALRRGEGQQELAIWDEELAAAAKLVNEQREQHARELAERFCQMTSHDLGLKTQLQFSRGWPSGQDYRECLAANHAGDSSRGATLFGPQRADLRILLDEHSGRNWASTGQQKLIGAALILAQTLIVAETLQRPVALVVDEPGADLDRTHLNLLMGVLESTPLQLFVACLDADALPVFTERHLFHVEHGGVKPLI